ncbi:outer membrane protein assembly factor BamE [Luminiphilus sp.]|nr:outer membrane protein assembly factor BamE [Luminiphilus sp.]
MARTFGYLKWAVAGCLFCALASCGSNFGFPGVYRINVEQGNVVNEEMVEKLRPGLNKRQVRYIMGTPLIEDSFHADRWDYRYLLRNGTETLMETRLTLWFEGDELARAEGPDAPDWAVSDASDTEDAGVTETMDADVTETTEADSTDETESDATDTAAGEADLTDTAETAL